MNLNGRVPSMHRTWLDSQHYMIKVWWYMTVTSAFRRYEVGPEAGGHLPLCSSRLVLETVPYIKDTNLSNVILTISRLRED